MSDDLIPWNHPAILEDEGLLADCAVTRTRRSGPGGQHRNKTETAIVLEHRPTGIRAEANETRSQAENLRAALWRLRLELALNVRQQPPQGPTRLWLTRCPAGRIAIRTDHRDFPAILAEALDVIADEQFDLASSARRLGCSTTQLVRLLDREPRGLQWVNRQRQSRGLRPLRP